MSAADSTDKAERERLRKLRKVERQRKLRAADPERFRAYERAAYAKNPEKYKAKWRRWRDNNPESYKDSQKRMKAKGREKQRKRDRDRYYADPEKARARVKDYRQRNLEKCRASSRSVYRKNRKRALAYAKANRDRNRAFLDQILRQCVCPCGEADWRCLEFHHTNTEQKDKAVTAMVACSRARLLRELNLCEIVCANCHLKRHAVNGVVRYAKNLKPGKPKPRIRKPDEELTEEQRKTRVANDRFRQNHLEELREYSRAYSRQHYAKNKAKVNAIKAETGCARCGERDPVCLEFHHRDPSTKVNQVACFCGFSSKRLMEEIAKCEILCACCHRKAHPREEVAERARKSYLTKSLGASVIQGELF